MPPYTETALDLEPIKARLAIFVGLNRAWLESQMNSLPVLLDSDLPTLIAEVERLQSDCRLAQDAAAAWRNRLAATKAEVERLRAALALAEELRTEEMHTAVEALKRAALASTPQEQPECTCDGGDQGEGCVSLPHKPECPVYAWERRPIEVASTPQEKNELTDECICGHERWEHGENIAGIYAVSCRECACDGFSIRPTSTPPPTTETKE